ncbi:MAG: hypothetical protein NXH75_14455, partial [Halobacteriovoraceae bacterium]|nr:hypothetical protein [Halobacteriovoraceae bacterium]
MKTLTTLILLFGVFLTHPALGFNPFEGKYRISTSESAHVYEMKTCIQGEKVEGCRGIILKNVELVGPLGHTKKIKHLFLRNLRSDETGKPVSKSCLNRYVGKMNKYLGVKSIMKGFSKRPKNLWRDPVDDTQFSMPTFMENTRVDANGSSYGLPVDKKTMGLSFKEPGGMNCSFSISMRDHIEDRPKEEPFKFEPIVTSDITVTTLPPLKEEKKEELDIIFSNENIQDGEKEEGETLKEEEHKAEPCEKHTPEGGDVLSVSTRNLTEEWEEIKPAVFEKKILMNADITYSFMKANIADATITLDTIDDKI